MDDDTGGITFTKLKCLCFEKWSWNIVWILQYAVFIYTHVAVKV
jgi:hypothetical protein